MTKDMTAGSPVRLIIGFAVPMFLGLLFQQFYSMVDTIIVGQYLGVNPLAGVGSTSSLNFMVIGFCMGVCNGFAIPVAQMFGAKEESRLRRFVTNSAWLAIGFSVLMTIAVAALCRPVLRLMNTPAEIFEYAYIYIFIVFCGIPCTFLYNLLAAVIRSLGLCVHSCTAYERGRSGSGNGHLPGRFRRNLPSVHAEKISDPESFKRRVEAGRKVYKTSLLYGDSHGTAVFGDRNRNAGSSNGH